MLGLGEMEADFAVTNAGAHLLGLVDDGGARHGEAAEPAFPECFGVPDVVGRRVAAHLHIDQTGAFEQVPYLRFLRERRPDLPLILEHLPLEEVPQAITRVRALAESPAGDT